jgi:hypothetical protein
MQACDGGPPGKVESSAGSNFIHNNSYTRLDGFMANFDEFDRLGSQWWRSPLPKSSPRRLYTGLIGYLVTAKVSKPIQIQPIKTSNRLRL